jgi:hypothetical protein
MAMKDITDKEVCKAYVEFKKFCSKGVCDNWPHTILEKWTGQPWKVCYRACERAQDRGYIECGVSLRSGWLTDKGLELIGGQI